MADAEHGELSYLEIPAKDIATSAAFYTDILGWSFVPEWPGSFDSPGGLIGALVTSTSVASDGGPVLWLFVRDIEDTLRRVPDAGGRIVLGTAAEGPRLLAKVADPAGNVIASGRTLPPDRRSETGPTLDCGGRPDPGPHAASPLDFPW